MGKRVGGRRTGDIAPGCHDGDGAGSRPADGEAEARSRPARRVLLLLGHLVAVHRNEDGVHRGYPHKYRDCILLPLRMVQAFSSL